MQNIDSQIRHEKALYERYNREMTVDGQLMYVGTLLARAARIAPDRIALICRDKKITYRDLFRRACVLATHLKEKGVKPRDRVLLFFENSIEFYIGYYGILQAGAVVAPLNTFLGERELAHIMTDAQPKLMVAQQALLERIKNMPALNIPIITETDNHIRMKSLIAAILKQSPDFMPARHLLAYHTLEHEHNIPLAQALLDEVMSSDPFNVFYCITQARIYRANGQYDHALTTLSRARLCASEPFLIDDQLLTIAHDYIETQLPHRRHA